MRKLNLNLTFFIEISKGAWGFGLMIPYPDRSAMLVFGPFVVGVDW